jgi:glucan biosynthesis protein C
VIKPIYQRRFDLDWLRVLVILLVFIFHSGRFFDTMDWHVKNSTTYQGVQVWTMFLASWMMPLIFVISGASIYFALNKVIKFVKDKVLRLLVPLGVGVFTHVSLAVYLERLTHHQFSGSYIQFLPHYFQGWYGDGGNFAWMGLHLWYLLVLFVFSLLFLPLFYLFKGSGQKVLHVLGDVFSWPGVVYLLAIPVVWLSIGINPRSDLGDRNWGGWSLLGYIPFFLYGFLIISHEGLQQTIQRWRWISLGLALAATASMIYTGLHYGKSPFGTRGYNLFNGTFGLNAWLWVLVALGFDFKYLKFNRPFLKYANEAVLPFYVLHQTVLLCVGYFITHWQIADPLKFIVISISSFSFIMITYEFLIRRNNVLRFLFGMKSLSAKSSPNPFPEKTKPAQDLNPS